MRHLPILLVAAGLIGATAYWFLDRTEVMRVVLGLGIDQIAQAHLRGPRFTLQTDHLPLSRISINNEAWIAQFIGPNSPGRETSVTWTVEDLGIRDWTTIALPSAGQSGAVTSAVRGGSTSPLTFSIEASDGALGHFTLSPSRVGGQFVKLHDAGISVLLTRADETILVTAKTEPGSRQPRDVAELVAYSEGGQPVRGRPVDQGGRQAVLSARHHGFGNRRLEQLDVTITIHGLREPASPVRIQVALARP